MMTEITQLLLSLAVILGSPYISYQQKIEIANQVIPFAESFIRQEIVPEFVPRQYRGYIVEAAEHTEIPVGTLAKLFKAENTNMWEVDLRGTADADDIGMTQLSPVAIKEITTERGEYPSFFEQNFNEEFNITNPRHQFLGAAVYLNYLKQFALPKEGIKDPMLRDILLSYNLGAKGYAMVELDESGDIDRSRYTRYENLLYGYDVINKI